MEKENIKLNIWDKIEIWWSVFFIEEYKISKVSRSYKKWLDSCIQIVWWETERNKIQDYY